MWELGWKVDIQHHANVSHGRVMDSFMLFLGLAREIPYAPQTTATLSYDVYIYVIAYLNTS